MITNFGVKNFFSFREGINITFELNSNCPIQISDGQAISNVLCFKGANGSGKTNALKILPLFKKFCCDSFNLKPDETIDIESFFFNTQPTDFYIEFLINKVKYRYEASLNKSKIFSEKIFRIVHRTTLIIEREDDDIIYCINEFNDLKIIKLRSNASIISTANQYEILSISDIYNSFSNILSNVYYFGLRDKKLDLSLITGIYKSNERIFQFVKKIIKKCDLGIKDIKIKSRIDEDNKKIYFPEFYHDTITKLQKLSFSDQSSGTKTLYLDLIYYYLSLKNGAALVMDEFDINYHPHILPLLVNLFTDKSSNNKDAQLIFTTHNFKIIDYMSKYRSYLINKKYNESYGYRLDEITSEILRNDRPISPVYDSGKIGGVPKI